MGIAIFDPGVLYFGDGSDASIRYDSGAWQTDESGSWASITTVSGKWTVSGTTLTLRRNFQFVNVTVPVGAILASGIDGQAEFFTHKVSGTLTVNGTLRAFRATGAVNAPGASRNTAGAGTSTTNTDNTINGLGQPGGSGSGGGSASAAGGNGATRTGERLPWVIRIPGRSDDTGTTTTGTTPDALMNPITYGFSPQTIPTLPGCVAYGGGGGALLGSGVSGEGSGSANASGQAARGGGGMWIQARAVIIGAAGSINADGEAAANGSAGTVSANLSIAGGGGAGGGGGGGTLCLIYSTITIDGDPDPSQATILTHVTTAGGTGGTGGTGRTRLDSVAGLTAWDVSTAYTLGQFRRPTIPASVGFVCVVAGTSALTEPTWPVTAGQTVADGGATWASIAEGEANAALFAGGNGRAGTAGVVVIEKVGF
jgi:hypothetical protein